MMCVETQENVRIVYEYLPCLYHPGLVVTECPLIEHELFMHDPITQVVPPVRWDMPLHSPASATG